MYIYNRETNIYIYIYNKKKKYVKRGRGMGLTGQRLLITNGKEHKL
jgi:hypothetical protein